jgi:threonylcarbamoyladenosine tRNA methylthiotransferase MtaB
VNSYETDAMEQLFRTAGYEVKEFSEQASVYVINTCTVTNIADRKSRQMIHRAKKINPDGIVVAVGCYVQAAKETLEADEMIDIVIGNNQKNHIVKAVEQYQVSQDETMEMLVDIHEEQSYEELEIGSAGEKTRAYIKIQDGCNQFCSYCIIPYVRGRIRSRDTKDILKETNRLVDLGYKEVVLTGIHLSSYGVDLLGDTDFVKYHGQPLIDLVEEISKVEGIERIRFGSLEPRIITEQFVKTLSQNSKFCPHFHLSLQSGCNETLKRMNRKYTAEEYYEKCVLLREHFYMPAITTDVIVGFPGETEEEFLVTEQFLKKVAFAQLHIFKYSKRKGTKAEAMPNQVPEQIKNVRSNQLITASQVMRQEYEDYFIGSIQKVLVEEEILFNEVPYYVGHNERYIKVAVPVNQENTSLENQVIEVLVTKRLKEDVLLGEVK